MARPDLNSASFPTLHSGMGQNSPGTVTGTNVKERDRVDILGSGNKKWRGEVTSRASGNTWNATVSRVSGSSAATEKASRLTTGLSTQASETVDVTVTNGDGSSDPVPTDSNVVP